MANHLKRHGNLGFFTGGDAGSRADFPPSKEAFFPSCHRAVRGDPNGSRLVGIDWEEACATSLSVSVNFKLGNEKLVKVLGGASGHLRSLLDRQGRPDGALRIAVIGGGCSGLQYKMDLVDGPRDRDILVESNGVNVVIDPKSALFVSGSELDYSDDLQQGGFKVSNPNALVTCSCGESFAA